jgi:hypothetical protein
MVIVEKIKEFAEKGERPSCYFYRTSGGMEIDLLVDGVDLQAYEIKFSASPTMEMTRSLAQFEHEYPVKKTVLLNLREESHTFSNGIVAEHWSKV